MRAIRFVPFVLLGIFALVATSPALDPASARADDKPGAAEGPVKGGANETQGKPVADGTSRVERAKKIVVELETTITILKAAKTADAESVTSLERALHHARSLTEPATLAELTEAERKAITDELRKEIGDGKDPAPAAQNPFEDWRQRALASAFKDADLTEDEQVESSKIINEWFQKSEAARLARDSKATSDLKGERDKSLERALGRKKAQKVINNLNSLSGRR